MSKIDLILRAIAVNYFTTQFDCKLEIDPILMSTWQAEDKSMDSMQQWIFDNILLNNEFDLFNLIYSNITFVEMTEDTIKILCELITTDKEHNPDMIPTYTLLKNENISILYYLLVCVLTEVIKIRINMYLLKDYQHTTKLSTVKLLAQSLKNNKDINLSNLVNSEYAEQLENDLKKLDDLKRKLGTE